MRRVFQVYLLVVMLAFVYSNENAGNPPYGSTVTTIVLVVGALLVAIVFADFVINDDYPDDSIFAAYYDAELEERDSAPSVLYVHCAYNPDIIPTFYEIPKELAAAVHAHDPDSSFVECLAAMVHPYGEEET